MTAADVNMAFAQAALPLGWTLIIIRIVQNWIDRSYSGGTQPEPGTAD
jgi:TRAP-type C4-dicarboxylate transport system permease small subunit